MIKLIIQKEETNTSNYNSNKEPINVLTLEVPEKVLLKLIADISKTIDDALGPRTE